MTPFMIFGLIICVAVGGFLSRFPWAKLIALIPVGMLVPSYYATGTVCGPLFFLDLLDAQAMCSNGYPGRQTFASAYVLTLVPVAVSAVLIRLVVRARAKNA
ncbi:hypothetical protein BFP70_16730 [Thioclava sp. SK-1]|uniref:hypothetical protein n=1 Tax=Thioclava sp. SK-1 TaxID=1889770 RepID=UPI00082687DC|nr:hypothetical protein [Thioclava sp. SK-1]OCX61094.1 hypothetical protein BFP70_16730 [Thioclava sp. SK-1]